MFTASHNPARYNGIKLTLAGAKPVGTESGLVEIEEMTNQFYESPARGELAGYSTLDLTSEWVEHVHSFVDVTTFRPLKIVADTANGMGGFVAPLVFAGTPFDLEILFGELGRHLSESSRGPAQP